MTFKPTLPPETFRVKPWTDSRDYFVVNISPDLETLRALMRAHMGSAHQKQIACCWSLSSKRLPDLRGVLMFALTDCGGGIVAHELAHAAFRSMEHRDIEVRHWVCQRMTPSKPVAEEETYCNVLERLTRQFWTAFYGLRLK